MSTFSGGRIDICGCNGDKCNKQEHQKREDAQMKAVEEF
uniref:Uncharacterized protein n=1 Tax=Acrobeloides nanus TaxID=290746 RepID=A0A914CLX2_9BILA